MSSQNDSLLADQGRQSVDSVSEILTSNNDQRPKSPAKSPVKPTYNSSFQNHRKGLSLNLKSLAFSMPSSSTKSLFLKRTPSTRPKTTDPRLLYYTPTLSASVPDLAISTTPINSAALLVNSVSPTRPVLTPRSSFRLETSENLSPTNNDSIFQEHFSSSSNIDIADDDYETGLFSLDNVNNNNVDENDILNSSLLLEQEPLVENLPTPVDTSNTLDSISKNQIIDDYNYEGVSSNSIEFDINRLSTSSVLPSKHIDSALLEGYIQSGNALSSQLSIPESLETVNSDIISQRDSVEIQRHMDDDNHNSLNNNHFSANEIDQSVEIYVEEEDTVLSTGLESRSHSISNFIEDRPPSFSFALESSPKSASRSKHDSIYSSSAPTRSFSVKSKKVRKTPSLKEIPTQPNFNPHRIPSHPSPIIPIVDADGVPFSYKQIHQNFPSSIHSSEFEITNDNISIISEVQRSEFIDIQLSDDNSSAKYKVHPPISNSVPHIFRVRDIDEEKSEGVPSDYTHGDYTSTLVNMEKNTEELKKKVKKHRSRKQYSKNFDYNPRNTGKNIVLYQGLVPHYPASPSEDWVSTFPYSNSMTTMKTTVTTPEPPKDYLEIQERRNAELKKLLEKNNQKDIYQQQQMRDELKTNSSSKKSKRSQGEENKKFHKHMAKGSTDSEGSVQRRVLKNRSLLVRLPITQSPPKNKNGLLTTNGEMVVVETNKPQVGGDINVDAEGNTSSLSTIIDNSSRFEDAIEPEVSIGKKIRTGDPLIMYNQQTNEESNNIEARGESPKSNSSPSTKSGKHRNRLSVNSFIDNNNNNNSIAKPKNAKRISSDYSHLRQASSDSAGPVSETSHHKPTRSQDQKYKKYFGTPSDAYGSPAGYFGSRNNEKIRSVSMPFGNKMGSSFHSNQSFINHTLNQNSLEDSNQGQQSMQRSTSTRDALRLASVNCPPLSNRVMNSYSTSPAMVDHDFITIGTQTLSTPYTVECDERGRPYCSVALSRLIIGCSLFFPPLWLLIGAGYFDNAFGVIPKREKRISCVMGGLFLLLVIVGLIVGLAVGL